MDLVGLICQIVFGTECVMGNEFAIMAMVWLMIFVFMREVLRVTAFSPKMSTFLAFLVCILIANAGVMKMIRDALMATALLTGPFAVVFVILSSILTFFLFWWFGRVFIRLKRQKGKQKVRERAMRARVSKEFLERLGKGFVE